MIGGMLREYCVMEGVYRECCVIGSMWWVLCEWRLCCVIGGM